jgi:hypothetical protein
MHARVLLLLALLTAHAAWADDSAPINKKNWLKHPLIVAVREVYAENEKLQREHKLKTEKKDYGCESERLGDTRTALRDEAGRIRKYIAAMGSSDSMYTVEHHYDAQKRLRFLFVMAGAVNDSLLELRIYFDESGKRIWEDRKLVKGPGWSFVNPWPEDLIVRDAEKTFQSSRDPWCEVL